MQGAFTTRTAFTILALVLGMSLSCSKGKIIGLLCIYMNTVVVNL